MKRTLCLLLWFGVVLRAYAADPVVSNIRASQRAGTKLVDVYYNVSDSDGDAQTVAVQVKVAGTPIAASSFSGHVGAGVTPGNNRHIVWDAGTDWGGQYSEQVSFVITANDSTAPSGMVLIPAGSFSMGDSFSEGSSDERPVHTVYVSAFYMDRCEVTKALWDEVYTWALSNGYGFDRAGSGKADNHPVHTVSWYDVVKWCNGRSQKEGRTPCYTVGGVVYKTGQSAPACNWSAPGYRLPTEAEWEKAARGGADGHRFPWSDTDTIQHGRANYYSSTSYSYDTSPTRGYHPAYNDGVYPYTSPVGSFSANGYGLYDMAGNVWEWCWDWYGSSYYGSSPGSDPRGPATGSYRVLRGGSWRHIRLRLPGCLSALLRPGLQQRLHRLPGRPAPRSVVSSSKQGCSFVPCPRDAGRPEGEARTNTWQGLAENGVWGYCPIKFGF